MLLHRKGGRWALNPFKVRYRQHGEELEKYDHDKEWWLGFEERWDHTEIIEFTDAEYTDEQLDRFKEIEYMPEDFGHVYSEYVRTGKFLEGEIPSDHPFNLVKLKKENEVQAQQATDNELQNVLQGQQLTDVELRLLMLEVNK